MTAALGPEHVTQTEELMLRFRTSKAGLLLRTASEHSADRIEIAVAAGRVRASVRLGDREKVFVNVVETIEIDNNFDSFFCDFLRFRAFRDLLINNTSF